MCKSASLDEVGALLRRWHGADPPQQVSLAFSGRVENLFSLSCVGKISDVGLLKFEVSWGENESAVFWYNDVRTMDISTDERSLYFMYHSNERLVISEAVDLSASQETSLTT